MDVAHSVNGVPIRLTYERWYHIVESHEELASYYHEVLETIEDPVVVVRGNQGTLKAARNLAGGSGSSWPTERYRETTDS